MKNTPPTKEVRAKTSTPLAFEWCGEQTTLAMLLQAMPQYCRKAISLSIAEGEDHALIRIRPPKDWTDEQQQAAKQALEWAFNIPACIEAPAHSLNIAFTLLDINAEAGENFIGALENGDFQHILDTLKL